MHNSLLIILATYFLMHHLSHSADASLDENLWAHQRVGISPPPEIHYGELTNGFSFAWHLRKPLKPEFKQSTRCSVYLRVNVGSVQEEDDELGIAHVLEHMAYRGGKKFPGDLATRTLQKEGMAFGVHQNAFTSPYETVYKFEIGKCTIHTLTTVLDVVRDIADGLTIDEHAVTVEKSIVDAEERLHTQTQMSSPFAWLDKRISPMGIKSVRDQFNAAKIRGFYQKWYLPQNMKLLITANDDELREEISPLVTTIFDSMKRGALSRRRILRSELSSMTRLVHNDTMPFVVSNVGTASFRGSPLHRSIEEHITHLERRMLAHLLSARMRAQNNNWSSGINVMLLDQTVYQTAMREELAHEFFPLLGLVCSTTTSGDDVALVYACWQNTLNNILLHGFSDDEIQTVIRQATEKMGDGFVQSFSSTTMETILDDARGFLPPFTNQHVAEIFVPAIKKFSSPRAIELLRELTSGPLMATLVGSIPFKDGDEFFAAVAKARSSSMPNNSDEVELDAPIYAHPAASEAATIVEQTESDGQTKIIFSNGIQVFYTHETGDDKGDFEIRVQSPKTMSHRARITDVLKTRSSFEFDKLIGIHDHRPQDLKKIFAEYYFHQRYSDYGNNEIISTGSFTMRRSLLTQLELLSGYFIDPFVDEQILARTKTRCSLEHSTTPLTPFKDFLLTVFGDDASSSLVSFSQQEIAAISSADVMAAYQLFFDKGNLSIFYRGPHSQEEVIDAVGKTFGAMEPRAVSGPLVTSSRRPVIFNSGVITRIHKDNDADKNFVMILLPVSSLVDVSEPSSQDQLQVLNNIILHRVLAYARGEMGASYSVSTDLVPSIERSGCHALRLFFDIDLAKAEAIIHQALTLIDDIADDLTSDEYARACAISPMRGAMPPTIEQVKQLASTIARKHLASYAF